MMLMPLITGFHSQIIHAAELGLADLVGQPRGSVAEGATRKDYGLTLPPASGVGSALAQQVPIKGVADQRLPFICEHSYSERQSDGTTPRGDAGQLECWARTVVIAGFVPETRLGSSLCRAG